MARTQAPEIAGPEKLQAPNAVTDFYAPPPRPVIDNTLGDLAQALSSFNTNLQHFAVTNRKATSASDRAAASSWVATHTNEEVKQAVNDGKLPAYADPVANDVINKDYARRVGADIKAGFDADIQSGKIDLTQPDLNLDELVTAKAKDAAAVLGRIAPGSAPAAAELATHIGNLRISLQEQRQKALVAQNVDQRTGVAYNQFNEMITKGGQIGAQQSPNGFIAPEVGSAVNANIRQAYGELGKSLGLPPKVMDDKLFAVLKANAKEQPEIVWQVLTEERKDPKTGQSLGALKDKPEYAGQAKELIDQLLPALGKKYDTAKTNDFTTDGIARLNRQDGSYWQMHNEAYENPFTHEKKIVDVDTVRKNTLATYQSWSDRTAADRKESADTKFDREFPVYEKANLPNPVWKSTLEGVAATLTSPAALSNPAARSKLGDAGELYLGMAAKNYAYIKNTTALKPEAQNFYDVYEVARKYMGLNKDQATDTAAAAVNQREDASDLEVKAAQRREIVQKVKSDFGAGTLSWLTGSGAANLGQQQKRLTEIASVLVRVNGMSTEDAVKNAEKLLKDRSYTINGHVITDQGYLPPKEMQSTVETALKQFFDQHGTENGVSKASELSIRPDADGNFLITKNTGSWFSQTYKRDGDTAVPAKITMEDLYRLRAQGQQEQEQKVIEKQHGAAERALSAPKSQDEKLKAGEAPLTKQQQLRLNAIKNKDQLAAERADQQRQTEADARESALKRSGLRGAFADAERRRIDALRRGEAIASRDQHALSLSKSMHALSAHIGSALSSTADYIGAVITSGAAGAEKLRKQDQQRPSSLD